VLAVAAAAARPAPTVRRDNNPRSPRSGAQVQVRPTAAMPAVIVKRSLSRLVTTAASPQLRLLPTPTRTLRNGKNTRTAFISAVVPTSARAVPCCRTVPQGFSLSRPSRCAVASVSRPPLTGALRRPARQITTGPVPDQGPQGVVVVAATWAAGSPTLTSLRTVEPGPRVRTVTTERYWKDTKTGDAEQAGARDPAAATPAGAVLIRSAAPEWIGRRRPAPRHFST
jgi:hypothetical protein